MKSKAKSIAVINTLASLYSAHREYTGLFSRIRTAEWSNIFISPAVLLIATILKNTGYDVKIYNDVQDEIDPDKINEDIILISTITPAAPRAYRIAALFPDRKIIMGGIHPSVLPEEAIKHADQVVVGECDDILADLAEGRIKQKVVYGNYLQDLNQLPFLDYSLLPRAPDILPVITSRGCNFTCNYCTVASIYGRYRSRSARDIVAELLHFSKNHGKINKIDFRIDADFTFQRKRAIEILSRMQAEGLKARSIAANSRMQVYKDHRLLSQMSDKNFTLCIGIESLDQRTLNNYRKQQKASQICEAIKTLKDYNIKVMGYLIFGSDQDDIDTLKRYTEFIHTSGIDFFQVSILTPYPGTGLYNSLLSQGRIFTTDWAYYDGLHVTYHPAKMKAYEMQKEFLEFYQREFSLKFLLNPKWIFNRDMLYHRFLIYTLQKMFRNDMNKYLSYLEV